MELSKIKKGREYPPYRCKCCGIGEIMDEHDICDVCGWEDDGLQNDEPDFEGGANDLSLNQYRAIWKEKQKVFKP